MCVEKKHFYAPDQTRPHKYENRYVIQLYQL